MKKIKNIFKTVLLAVALGSGTMLTSCTDFLTIYPTNSVIHENYWQTAEDVNGMLATSYLQLLGSDAIQRMIIWGELRADNINVRNSASNTFKYIVEANIKEDNEYCTWAPFYKAINFANMVLEFAPEVVERDPDFTQGDLDIVMGEMYALRALSHFYLVRAFRDIPLAYKASVNDAELIDYPQVHPVVALDSIMADLDRAESKVMRSGGFPNVNAVYNYGRITRNAVLAMKADVNLWRAAFATYYAGSDSVTVGNPDDYYEMAIQNCDDVINEMNLRMKEYYDDRGGMMAAEVGPGTKNPYYLATNADNALSTKNSEVYDYLFGDGKDVTMLTLRGEIIFELIFDGSTNYNNGVRDLYGVHTSAGQGVFCVSNLYTGDNSKYGENDIRFYSSTTAEQIGNSEATSSDPAASEVGIAKYTLATSPGYRMNESSYRNSSSFDANWVLYRKTDVMLMKAEAIALRSSFDSEKDIYRAFELVKAVNDRSLLLASDSLTITDAGVTATELMELILDERVRELSFEGKRWFDLVRVALRDKSTKNILFVANKIEGGGSNAVQKKMQSINSLFFPISEYELNVNPLLKQNPAYEESSSIEQN